MTNTSYSTAFDLLAEHEQYLRARTALSDDMASYEVVLTMSRSYEAPEEAMAERHRLARALAQVLDAEGIRRF